MREEKVAAAPPASASLNTAQAMAQVFATLAAAPITTVAVTAVVAAVILYSVCIAWAVELSSSSAMNVKAASVVSVRLLLLCVAIANTILFACASVAVVTVAVAPLFWGMVPVASTY